MSKSYLMAARRSAVSPRHGAFADLLPHQLAVPVVKAVLADAGLDTSDVGEIIVSNALGAGGNPARLVALASDLPERIGGLSIDRQCCGGLDALLLADAMIRSGQHDVVVAGGVESYSRRPLRSHTFADGSEPRPYDQAPFTPWPERDPNMAVAADQLAQRLSISRAEQDDWAIHSHAKALASQDKAACEIVPIAELAHDPFGRKLSQRLCDRSPVIAGSITSANMCVAADAAAFVVLVSERVAKKAPHPLPELLAGATVGGEPDMPGLGPVPAIRESLAKAGLSTGDLTIAEIMEAFAVQAIACQREAGIDPAIVNPFGGSLARGHPIGASGAVLAVRLFHHLQRQNGVGLAAIAAAGGLGTALIVKSGTPGL
ncbi:thiolase family protein [Cohaesibacter intestini]|uniref:thiolase family protein n=1 Tax=Cohaesibacter intestini TaxID=2211145 RepID=UPI000DE951D9|nr:thiolase family protein [Cohaesibacter intestini]